MSKRTFKKKPLYRSVNTRTHGVKHGNGGEYRHQRNTKREAASPDTSMHSKHRHGRDYTPLFKFLIAKVGLPWESILSEAVSRLDTQEPIFWLVATDDEKSEDVVRIGENSYFSGLYVDAGGILQKVNPSLSAANMEPFCTCCTHTFNGEVFGTGKIEPDDQDQRGQI